MAIFDFNRLAYGVNEDDIVARVLTYGPIKQFNTSGGTSTSFKMDPPGRIAVKYEGEGFKYNAKGDPKQGTIESIQVTSKGHPEETFKITERVKFDVRGEFYNLLNHANFNIPGFTFGAADFGVVSSSRPGRTAQIALRLSF